MDWQTWGPPLGVLAISGVVGFVLNLQMKRASSALYEQGHKAELHAAKQQTMDALRELELDKEKLSAGEYAQQKELLVQKASDILAKIDSNEVQPMKQESSSVSLSVWYYVIGGLAFFSLLAVLINKYSAPRTDGQVMTGGTSSGMSAQEIAAEWEAKREERRNKALEAIGKNPNDIDALNVLTYEALLVQDMQSAMTYMEQVRNIDGQDPDFMVHLAILQMSVGMTDRAEVGFAQALLQRPQMAKALLWKGYMQVGLGNIDEAKQTFAGFDPTVLQLPEEKYLYQGLQSEMDRPPAVIGGTITLQGDLPTGILFIVAKRSKEGGGPPVAVKKIPNPTFPMSFELGKGDMVMGGIWPEQVWLEVRIDTDGNAMTREENELTTGMLGPFAENSFGLDIALGTVVLEEKPE